MRRIVAAYYALSGLVNVILVFYQGRRAPLRCALAPGFHIPRLRRFIKFTCLTFVDTATRFSFGKPTTSQIGVWNVREIRFDVEYWSAIEHVQSDYS